MKIYTRRGDDGETGLLGGDRVPKSDPRVAAYGTVDELNAFVGLALARIDREGQDERAESDAARLERVQDDLFAIGARLAASDPDRADDRGLIPDFPPGRVEDLEDWIDDLQSDLPELDAFIHPGGSPAGAQLHAARTVCRRAERTVVRLADRRPELEEVVLPYLNRLSDLLFTLARAVNHRAGVPEIRWQPVRERDVGGEAP
jgi:cob(I)alamin adenosyltransferase